MTLNYTIGSLHVLFDECNKRFFKGKLPTPMITIQRNERKGVQAYGWCTVNPIWSDRDGDKKYEINFGAEYVTRTLVDLAGTLIHEMVHMYCAIEGIQDTSRGNTYHNKRFKTEAEKRGLIIEQMRQHGYALTSVQPETIEWLKTLQIDEKHFTHSRVKQAPEAEREKKQKQSSRKYVCPSCGLIVRATKEVNIKCEDCDEHMELEEAGD